MPHLIPREGILRDSEKAEIEILAEGLTENEVSLYLWGDPYDVLGPAERREFDRAYVRGRTRMKLYAIQALKESMRGRNGLQASLAVLTRFAEAFPQIADGDGNPKGVPFSFRIVAGDE